MTSSNTPTCVVAEVAAATTEYEVCSRRGLCDFTTGICTCFTGFSGSGCHQDAIVTTYSDNQAINLVEATGAACRFREAAEAAHANVVLRFLPTYTTSTLLDADTGTVMKLRTNKASATDFNFMTIQAATQELVKFRGDGNVDVSGEFILRKR